MKAIEAIRTTGIARRQAMQIIGALVTDNAMQWPAPDGPHVITARSDLTGLPVGTVLRLPQLDVVLYRDGVAWWAAGSEEPWAISEIPLPVEVLA